MSLETVKEIWGRHWIPSRIRAHFLFHSPVGFLYIQPEIEQRVSSINFLSCGTNFLCGLGLFRISTVFFCWHCHSSLQRALARRRNQARNVETMKEIFGKTLNSSRIYAHFLLHSPVSLQVLPEIEQTVRLRWSRTTFAFEADLLCRLSLFWVSTAFFCWHSCSLATNVCFQDRRVRNEGVL